MRLRWVVRPNTYHDSVKLMRISDQLSSRPGVQRAAAVMGTPLNRDLLADEGLLPEGIEVGPEDLLVAVLATDEVAEEILGAIDALLTARSQPPAGTDGPSLPPVRLLEQAARAGEANIAIIAVPGQNAAVEAYVALHAGLHVFLFSDNVSMEDEVCLKRLAAERDLLMMGPDCGTAIIAGVGLGFANRVNPGPVGIVGASGTGIQELCCLLDGAGVGIANAIGTGGRDLSSEVGGSMTRRAIWALEEDERVEVIAVISKPADHNTSRRLRQEMLGLSKPAVVCLLGERPHDAGPVRYAKTIRDMARTIAELLAVPRTVKPRSRTLSWPPGGNTVYGLFAGGTLRAEAELVLGSMSVAHDLIDLGADQFTEGRAHPMIDARLRAAMLPDLASKDDAGAVLIDVILGDLAHPDPAGAVLPALAELRDARRSDPLPVIAVLVGTSLDPQDVNQQRQVLEEIGVRVETSAASAATAAGHLIRSAS